MVNPLSLKRPSKHQLCMYMYAQFAIVSCCNDSISLPFFSIQCLSLSLSKRFLFYFFFWVFDGRIETLNLYISFVSKILKGWASFILVKLVVWGQRIWVPRPISNNKPKGPAEEENVRG